MREGVSGGGGGVSGKEESVSRGGGGCEWGRSEQAMREWSRCIHT